MKIRNRITLYFILITGTIIFVSFLMIYIFSVQDRINRFERRLQKKALTSANLLLRIDQLDSVLLKTIEKNKEDYLVEENIVIFDSYQNKIYDNNDSIKLNSIINIKKSLLQLREKNKFYKKNNQTEIIGQTYFFKNKKYYIIASAVDLYGLNYIKSLQINLFLIFLLIIITISIIGWRFSKSIITPIEHISNEVNLITSDNLKKRVPQNNNFDEIGKLINTFNKLLDRIENGYELQKNFTSNISHELKNPLTAITSQLEVAKLKELNNIEYKALINSLLDDVLILNQITESMILLTRLTSNQNNIGFPLTRLDELILEIIEDFNILNPSFLIKTNLINLPDDFENLFYPISTEIFKRAIFNILENAKKYSSDKQLVINLNFQNENFVVDFLNNTIIKFPVKNVESLIEPFQRGNATKEIEGFGLGLSIVNQIIKSHSFQIKINLSEENVFSVQLFSGT